MIHYSGEVPIVVDKSKAKYFNGTWYMDTSQDRAKYGLIDKSRYSEVSTYISGMPAGYTKFTSILNVHDKNFLTCQISGPCCYLSTYCTCLAK